MSYFQSAVDYSISDFFFKNKMYYEPISLLLLLLFIVLNIALDGIAAHYPGILKQNISSRAIDENMTTFTHTTGSNEAW